jgi:hypothetical protein
MIELAKAVKELVDGQAKFPDWNKRDDIKSALKVGLILLLDVNRPHFLNNLYPSIYQRN